MEDSVQGKLNFGRVVVFGVVLVCVFCSGAFGQPWDGNGVESDPYQIWTAEDMQAIGADSNYWSAHFKLMADIDLGAYTGTSFNIIGNGGKPFSGVFDGDGKKVLNFTYESSPGSQIGMFGYVKGANAEIRELGLVDPNIKIYGSPVPLNAGTLVGSLARGRISGCHVENCRVVGSHYVGGLVGYIGSGSIADCNVGGSVSGSYGVGGLAGNSVGLINDSHCVGNISGHSRLGGLVGNNGGTILRCTTSGSVDTLYNLTRNRAGGLVGHNSGAIFYCSSTADVAGHYLAGGLVGANDNGMISNSYTMCTVWGSSSIGGLIGWNYRGNILGCYSISYVDGDAGIGGLVGHNENFSFQPFYNLSQCYSGGVVKGRLRVGGLVGLSSYGFVENSYSIGDVLGDERVGGLVGENYSDNSITNCYVAASVDGNTWVGGVTGYDEHFLPGNYAGSFWDIALNPSLSGVGNKSDPNVVGKTTAEMQTESTFTDAGWDFVGEVVNGANDIWEICEGTNYPKFVWQIPVGDMVCPDGVNFEDYAYFAERWYETDYGDVNGVELTGDGRVNWEDFGLFAGWWMARGCGECGGADLTGEGDVDYLDLGVFAGHWLKSEYGDCGGAELTGDGVVGRDDLREFSDNWLKGM